MIWRNSLFYIIQDTKVCTKCGTQAWNIGIDATPQGNIQNVFAEAHCSLLSLSAIPG
jgi:hypothetical protein